MPESATTTPAETTDELLAEYEANLEAAKAAARCFADAGNLFDLEHALVDIAGWAMAVERCRLTGQA